MVIKTVMFDSRETVLEPKFKLLLEKYGNIRQRQRKRGIPLSLKL